MFLKSLFYCENSAFRHELQYKNLVRRLPDETRGNCVGFRNGGHREQRNRPRVGHLYILNLWCELNKSHIISTDEDPSLRIESFAVINLRGVSTNKTIIYFIAMQTYKELIQITY